MVGEWTTQQLQQFAENDQLKIESMSFDSEGLYLKFSILEGYHLELSPISKGDFGYIKTNMFGDYTPKEQKQYCQDFRRGDMSNFNLKDARIIPEYTTPEGQYIECNIISKKEDEK